MIEHSQADLAPLRNCRGKTSSKGRMNLLGDPVAYVVRMDELRLIGQRHGLLLQRIAGCPVEITVTIPGGRTHVINAKIGFASPVVEVDNSFCAWVNAPNQRDGKGWLMGPGMAAVLKLR